MTRKSLIWSTATRRAMGKSDFTFPPHLLLAICAPVPSYALPFWPMSEVAAKAEVVVRMTRYFAV
jgi:hypothetical protein